MRQIGIVVRDIDKVTMKHWVEVCGVGPWFYAEKLPLTAYSYKGKTNDIPHLSIALANSGDIQLELIQQRCQTPSLYWDFLNAGKEGSQHWSSWPVQFSRDQGEGPGERGWHVGQEGESERGPFVLFSRRRTCRHGDRDGRGDADPHAHLRPGARGRKKLGRQRPDPRKLAEAALGLGRGKHVPGQTYPKCGARRSSLVHSSSQPMALGTGQMEGVRGRYSGASAQLRARR